MGKKTLVVLVVAVMAALLLPAMALAAGLVNEYGMHYAGQGRCAGCHDRLSATSKSDTVHGDMAKLGLVPAAPSAWTEFRAAGDPPVVAGTKGAVFDGGGSYAIDMPWITLGDYDAGLATEYLFFKGTTDPTVMPWNLVEGLVAEPGEGWVVGEDLNRGLYDVVYGCQRCHMLGTTVPLANATTPATIPNPAVTVQPSAGTARQWAREDTKSVADFMSDPAVSYPGMSIQCENCHGTGVAAADTYGHMLTGVEVNDSFASLGNSQVCGQCHGSYTNVAGTLGIYGFTTTTRMADYVDINGASGGQSYTYIPTEAEFLAAPTAYWMFPNGSNAKGNHYYYNEWAASAHSYRGALYSTATPYPTEAPYNDAMAFQAAGHGHYNATTDSNITSKCYQCHTGEGYIKSKGAKIAEDFVPANGNVGFMGQECSVCHNAHPTDLAEENVVRAPDGAGVRSNAGLATANASICEDCHNWQFEVQSTSPVYKPQADLASRGGPSHPQRETLHGKVMLDVPAAGEFMPGVKCEECHMPKTNKAATRISHGMKPMLPGDAEEWMGEAGAAYMGEDSCSKCHAGETREELQANIDAWQLDASNAATAAAAAITAAAGRSEYSLTDANSAGYILAGRATWNYKAYVNDISGSVHNPEYVVAGLEKAKQLADSVGGAFAGISAPKSLLPGVMGFVSGKVVNGDGSPAAGGQLVLYANGSATAETAKSAANGGFSFAVMPSVTTTYSVAWVRSGDARTTVMSAAAKVAAASKTTLKASAASIVLGKYVKLSGAVTPPAPGKVVKIQYRRTTSAAWKALTSATLSATSTYAKSFKPTAKGAWYFRSTYSGTTGILGSKSAAVRVIVK